MQLAYDTLSGLVARHMLIADDVTWNRFTSIRWEEIQHEVLTKEQRSAVAFVTFIEDHLPGYFAEYMKLFPIDEDVPLEQCTYNRELYHFLVRWAQEEDRHAHVLANYQLHCGVPDARKFHSDLTLEGRKRFTIDFREPAQIFTYALLQEKATQLFYNQLRDAIQEPVLKSILLLIARDEARHFAFFASLVGAYLEQFGEEMIPHIHTVVENFKMPLHNTLNNYWRWSLIVSDAAGGYKHAQAYEELANVVNKFAGTPTRSKAAAMTELLHKMTVM